MSMTSYYDPSLNVVFAASTGNVGIDDLMSYYNLISQYDLKEGYRVYVDYSDITLKLSQHDVVKMAEARNKIASDHVKIKIAVYCHQNIVFGLARMYQMLLDEDHYDLRVFRDSQKAKYWLGIQTNHSDMHENPTPI